MHLMLGRQGVWTSRRDVQGGEKESRDKAFFRWKYEKINICYNALNGLRPGGIGSGIWYMYLRDYDDVGYWSVLL